MAERMEGELSVRTDAECQHVAVCCPLMAAVRRACAAGAQKLNLFTPKDILILTPSII